MNVFYLDQDPEVAASMHVWHKHVIKMILEYAQLLSTAHRILDGEPHQVIKLDKNGKPRKKTIYSLSDEELNDNLYTATHINHPSAQWVRESWQHYGWVYECMMALGEEYERRQGRVHKTIALYSGYLKELPRNIPNTKFQEPPQCMPDKYKVKGDAVAAYNNYYEYKKGIL